ncbi:hypothetical protein RHGRI_004195 [Rhododendron griersonianum]|uniref:Transmembrane 9 superfamily member n=1 Tax=Rhododendron griersonianum TaxID=479676 RepID=A0AAV6L9Q5_9ERIC|nr:hypothetical protein RHGRI_004195 [Rhododendron griersonianum]
MEKSHWRRRSGSKKSEKSSRGESGEKKSSSMSAALKERRRWGKEIKTEIEMARRMAECSAICLVAFLIMFCASQVRSAGSNHQYKAGDTIPLYANKAGPFHNPSETYAYNDLPYCSPDQVEQKKESLGEVLNGYRLVSTAYKLDFLAEKESEVACKKKLTKEEVSQFRAAVVRDYYFQMYYDDLPIWAFIGKVEDKHYNGGIVEQYHLFTHLEFEILYNKGHVIEITLRTNPNSVVDLTEDEEVDVEFTYTVRWKETDNLFEKRIDKYLWSSTLPHYRRVHWFAVMNSCLTVLIVLGCLLTFYVRVLEKDINKYASDEELLDNQEERGWKSIHGDVFRYPKHKSLFAAAIGSGTQLFVLSIFIIMLGVVGVFQPYSRGTLFTALVFVYAITSVIAGYTTVSLYYQLEGTNWVRNILLTGCVFGGPLLLAFCFLNFVAFTYRVNAALPLGTILLLLSIWLFGASPLLLFGGIAGRNSGSDLQAPCRTTKCPREIPTLRWYRGTLPQMAVAGILPFGVIYVETYYLLASIWGWGHRIYTIYGILLIVFIILIIITVFVTVALTYFQLAAEDHEWWWRSFFCGGSTGLFIYGYCLYYYYRRSDMSGFLQTSFFFGYMGCICYGIFLMLGTIGFRASLFFVRHIYGSIKCE